MCEKLNKSDIKYTLDGVDNCLFDIVKIPSYWVLRDKCGAFSGDNVNLITDDKQLSIRNKKYLNETGLRAFSAFTYIGGAIYHMEVLFKIEKKKMCVPEKYLDCPDYFLFWQHSEAAYGDLYSALNAIANFSFSMTFPAEYQDLNNAGLSIDRCCDNIPNTAIVDYLKSCKERMQSTIRHHSVHFGRPLIVLDGSWSYDSEFKKGSTNYDEENLKPIVSLLKEDIESFESKFDCINRILINEYADKFINALSLIIKD